MASRPTRTPSDYHRVASHRCGTGIYALYSALMVLLSRMTAAVLLSVLLVGCGKSTAQPRALSSAERLQQVCANLRARLSGISDAVGLRDPEPALFRSPALEIHLQQAAHEARAALDEAQAELGKVNARYANVLAPQLRSLNALAAELPHEHPRSSEAGFRLSLRYAAIEAVIERGCLRAISN